MTANQVLVSMLSTAYEAHFNAPLFYRELQNNTIPRYSKMVSTSFLASVATMMAVRICCYNSRYLSVWGA